MSTSISLLTVTLLFLKYSKSVFRLIKEKKQQTIHRPSNKLNRQIDQNKKHDWMGYIYILVLFVFYMDEKFCV